MYAHSDARCQCNSRMPPAVSRMLTLEISSEIAKSACVTWRAQPPFWMRFDALLNVAQGSGMLPTSVAGGDCGEGNWPAIAGFCGPGSVMLAGLSLALTAPCGGRSGLPKDWACAFAAAATSEPAAVAASRVRRDTISMTVSRFACLAMWKDQIPHALGQTHIAGCNARRLHPALRELPRLAGDCRQFQETIVGAST